MSKVISEYFGELAVLPRPAELPMKESVEYLTDVITSYNGTEQRLQLRNKPRRTLEYTVPLQAWQMQDSMNTNYGAIRKKWVVPMWAEAQYVGTISEGQTYISCNTGPYDYRNTSSLAFLYSSCDDWQVVDISSIDPTTLYSLNPMHWIHKAWVMPARLGWVSNITELFTNGSTGKLSVTYELDIKDTNYYANALPPQYLDNDVYTSPVPLLSNGLVNVVTEQKLDETEALTGYIDRRTPWLHPKVSMPYRVQLNNAEEISNYRRFMNRRAGKFQLFWMPSFRNDMRLVNDFTYNSNIINVFFIYPDSYDDYALLHKHIAINMMNGSWIFTEIRNVFKYEEYLYVSTEVMLNVNAKDIYRICFLGLHRFDSDRVEISWIGNGVASADVRVIEVEP